MPVRVFCGKEPPVPTNVTVMLAPSSPTTVTTPVAWIASACVAPPVTPVPRANTGGKALTSAVIVQAIGLLPTMLTFPLGSVWRTSTEPIG